MQKYSVNLFYFIFFLWYVVENLVVTTFDTILGIEVGLLDTYNTYLVFSLLLLQIIFFQKYTSNEMTIICFFSILIIISTIQTGNNYILSLWMFIVASKNVDVYKVINIAYKILLCIMPIIIMSCLCGLIPDQMMYRGDLLRHSWGYSHPNILGMKILQFVIYSLILKNKSIKNNIYMICLILLATIFVYIIPNSQTPTILLMVLLLLFLFYIFCGKHGGLMRFTMKVMVICGIICNVCSVVFCIINVKEYPLLRLLDKSLSLRFSESHKAYLSYGISVFGQRIYITEEARQAVGLSGFYYLDNAYMILLVRYGIIIYLIFSIGYIAYMIKMYKENRYTILMVFFVYALYGLMEPSMFRFTYNILLIFLHELLYGNKMEFIDKVLAIRNKRYRLVLNRRV